MSGTDAAGLDSSVDAERGTLLRLGYRMLGTVADAEDAVQETYARWYRMSAAERAVIERPAAWLVRVAGRVCLDLLGSARARRERYLGDWLPEPLPADTAIASGANAAEDPLERVSRDEAVGSALLVVLESLTPAERVAFVLHDVFAVPFAEIAEVLDRTPAACRQLASSARAHVRAERRGAVSRHEHDAVVRAFATAVESGDLAGLVAVLDPDVVLRADGCGVASSALRPILGAERVVRYLVGVRTKFPGVEMAVESAPDGLALVGRIDGRVDDVVTMDVVAGRIVRLRVVRNPAKLGAWRPASGAPRPD